MSLPLVIALNITFAVLLVAALAWTMTRPRSLRPHVPAEGRRLALVDRQARFEADEQERRAA